MNYPLIVSSLILRQSRMFVAMHQERLHGCEHPGPSENQIII